MELAYKIILCFLSAFLSFLIGALTPFVLFFSGPLASAVAYGVSFASLIVLQVLVLYVSVRMKFYIPFLLSVLSILAGYHIVMKILKELVLLSEP